MSRGPGRLQRLVLKRLQETPERRLSRRELEKIFVDQGRYTSSNLLRTIRSLERMRRLSLLEGQSLDDSFVSLLRRVEPVSNELLSQLLAELGGRS